MTIYAGYGRFDARARLEGTMADINPDVLAQMHRIHVAVNSGTVDKATVNDALKLMHDFLTGVAYDETHPPPPSGGQELAAGSDAGEAAEEEGGEDGDVGGDHPAKRKSRKKR